MPAAVARASAAPPTLESALTSTPQLFLQPTPGLHASSLAQLKSTLDPLANSISAQQSLRQQQTRRKRKRGGKKAEDDSSEEEEQESEPLRLKRVHVEGFGVEQVWEQVRRVVEAAVGEVERDLKAREEVVDDEERESGEEGLDGEEEGSELGEEGVDWEYDGPDAELEDGEESAEEGIDGEEELDDEDMEEDIAEGDETRYFSAEEDLEDGDAPQEFVADPNGLNDGFFSIDDFNRQAQFMEQADQRGDDDGAASDEEEVDWNSNPMTATTGTDGALNGDDMDEDEDEEDGPTFGNADLNAPESESEDDGEELDLDEMEDIGGMGNTNNIKYVDFFAPPATKARKNKKGRPNPHNFPAAQQMPAAGQEPDEVEQDLERTMSAVHRDLFEDESEEEDEAEVAEDLDPSDPRARRSTHERRRAALAEEIRRLEAANVAKREWTLSGEARAADRPINSLLEEDLDFERAGKPVPVITAEVSESLEELIKRRILAQDFQDLIRRRPDDLATGPQQRRGRIELDDSKAKVGLAADYEEEHTRSTDPDYISASTAATQAEEAALAALWTDISSKLDSLSSWHFRPKAPAPQLDIRVDAPVVRLEDARPDAGVDANTLSQLAPQEVYKAGESADRKSGERVTRGGGVVADEEMGREERKRWRRREKERGKKAAGGEKKVDAGAAGRKKRDSKRDVVGQLERGGVRVIGKEGVTDVLGRKVAERQVVGAGGYKL